MQDSMMKNVFRSLFWRKWLIPVCVIASTFVTTQIRAGSPVYVGSKSSENVSIDKIDHSDWHELLTKYVDANGLVNYRALKADRNDTAKLSRYLQHLSSAHPNVPASRNAKLAFWINAYNAVTVQGILREYPTTSIRNHTAKLVGYNIWHDLQLHVGGAPYSLDTIEHKILRKMNEPRIHFAIVCASIGCPRLLNQAYTTKDVVEKLEVNAIDFFSRKQNFRHDASGNRFYLSAIIDWFGEDFGQSQSDQLRRIAGWLPSTAAKTAAQTGSVKIAFLDYDWNLNEQK